jgi:glucokinase
LKFIISYDIIYSILILKRIEFDMNLKTDKVVLSIDIGGSKIMVGIINSEGEILYKEKEFLKNPLTKYDVLGTVLRLSNSAINKYGRNNIRCAGVTIPGLTDAENGIWVYSSFSGIKDFYIAKALTDELRMPVYIENDVNACALGEMKFGSCANVKNFLWITMSNGIGGCVVIDGRIHEGAYKNAGEIGHINVVENGYPCKCGNRGCVEAYAAGPAILRRYCEKMSESMENTNLNAKSIAAIAKSGDRIAKKVYEQTGYYLGKAIAAAVNTINPQKVILGGGVAMDMELFYPQMKNAVDEMVFRDANKELAIEKTALSYEAALIGAVTVAMNRMSLLEN